MGGRVERRSAPLPDLVRVDDLLEFRGGSTGGLQVTGRNCDLDLRGKRAHPYERRLDVLQEVRDPGDRAVDLPLGETEERQPGLRITAPLVRGRVRLLRAGEVSTAPADLADLVVPAGGDAAVEVAELLAGRHRLQLGRRPVTAQAHDLGAVQPAGARKSADIGLVAPPVRGFGPLGRAPEVADVLARADRHAVDDPGRERP